MSGNRENGSISTSDPTDADEPEPDAGEPERRPRRLLLVDDDEHILRSLKIYLELERFHVITADSGRAALERVDDERPDMVLLDVMMPELDGFAVLKEIKGCEETKGIPVIMLTAKGMDADVLRGYQMGAASYMTKPVNYDELVDNINLIFQNEDKQAATGK